MSISFSTAIGNLFPTVGKCGALVANMDSYQTTQQTAMINTVTGLTAQLNAQPDIQSIVGSSYIGQLNGAASIGQLASNVAVAILNRLVFEANPGPGQTLQSGNTLLSLLELIREMRAQGATVRAQTVTATAGSFVGTGNGAVVASVRRPFDGRILENSFAENLTLTCIADSYSGGATAGNEGFALTGAGQQTNVFAFDWPLGSGANTQTNAIDGETSAGNGNSLTNSGFTEWTDNVPDGWILQVGTAGTNISQETTIVFESDGSLKITGDASGTLTRIAQQFGTSDGTPVTLQPSTQYGVNLWVRRDGVAAGAGVLTVELVDGNGVVVQDNGSNLNTFDISLTNNLTVFFAAYSGSFRTPEAMPDEMFIRLRLSTALTNGRSIYVDTLSLGQMSQSYISGPFLSVHSGAVPFVIGDYAISPVTNSRGAGGTLNTWQTLWSRCFSQMLQSGLLLPSSSSPTISDSLIS